MRMLGCFTPEQAMAFLLNDMTNMKNNVSKAVSNLTDSFTPYCDDDGSGCEKCHNQELELGKR